MGRNTLFMGVIALGIAFALADVLDKQFSPVEADQPTRTANTISTAPPAGESFRPEAPGPRAAALRKASDGHFWADAKADGTRVKFMVDTGASTVALTYRDAERMDLDPDNLNYSWRISTAGGETRGASVLIDEIKIGNVKIQNVEAMVLRDELSTSLLGMSFLGELHSYEFRGNTLIIRQ